MKPISLLSYLKLTVLGKPVCDRQVYKLIRKHKFRSIVEVGLESGERCLNMIQVAKKYGSSPSVRYTGVDQFDARQESDAKLSLIQMHRKLQDDSVKVQLVPGDLQSAIARIANSHVRTDLILISAGFEPDQLESSWFYVPRMIHAGSLVLVQSETGGEFRCLNRLEIEKLAAEQNTQRAAA